MKTLFRGAEAVLNLKDGNVLVKERIEKPYRARQLDEALRKKRTRSEAKLLNDARYTGIKTPIVFNIGKFDIEMEYIEGVKLKETLGRMGKEELESTACKIGEYAGKLHSFDIIHGDLTTSNFILKGNELYLIDFGLGFYSKKAEDKAVDLHLLYQALKSTHFNILKDVWEIILKAYAMNYEDANNIIKALERIRERGRYK